MRIIGEKGGYIATPAHAVEFDAPPESIIAWFRYLKIKISSFDTKDGTMCCEFLTESLLNKGKSQEVQI